MTSAYEAGQQAHQDGNTANPYDVGSEEYEDFVEGFQQQWYASLDEEF